MVLLLTICVCSRTVVFTCKHIVLIQGLVVTLPRVMDFKERLLPCSNGSFKKFIVQLPGLNGHVCDLNCLALLEDDYSNGVGPLFLSRALDLSVESIEPLVNGI